MLIMSNICLTDRGYELLYSLATTFKLKQLSDDSRKLNFTIGQKVWSLHQHFSQSYFKVTEISTSCTVSAVDII